MGILSREKTFRGFTFSDCAAMGGAAPLNEKPFKPHRFSIARRTLLIAAMVLLPLGCNRNSLQNAKPALTGTVTSTEEGKMEGVLVSAKRNESRITVTVVTDANGS